MIIDPYKYHISIYSIFLISSIFIGFTISSLMLIKQKFNRTIIICSVMLNGALLFYFGLVFTFIVNIGKGKPTLGLTSMGGAFGIAAGAVIMYFISKDRRLIQTYLTTLPLIYSISKIGCFFGGCCGGLEYHGPLAVNYIRHGEPVNPTLTFPVPLLESVVFAIIFIIVAILFKRLSFKLHLAVNIILCAIAKFGLDFLRSSHIGEILSINQILCLIAVVIAIIVVIVGEKIFTAKPANS